ncbi:MAG: RtcB family protein, partial [Planctomycetales bacterium]
MTKRIENVENPEIIARSEATGILPTRSGKGKPITVIGTQAIRDGFDATCLQQALNARDAPGVSELVINPDAHAGYGAPVGCVLVSPTHVYPGPVGVDVKCSMSLLQLDLPNEDVDERRTRRALINAVGERIPTGAGKGSRHVPKGRIVEETLGEQVAIEGASESVCQALGIPTEWATRCEDSFHLGHDDTRDALGSRLQKLQETGMFRKFVQKVQQLGSYGGGNHFGECEAVHVDDNPKARETAETFGLKDGNVAFLSHCGSRGFGFNLAKNQFRVLGEKFDAWDIPLPGNDRELVYAPLGSPEANDYLD